MKKRDLYKEIGSRKYGLPNPLFYGIYSLVNKTPLLGGKYHPSIKLIDDFRKCKTGCFLIWNHQSRRDHCFFTSAAFPRRVNIVAEYNSFFRSHLYMPFKLAGIIPKKVYSNDLVSLRAMRKVIKSNGIVALSPEGTSSIFGDNQPIVPGTGRFLQSFNVPVYIMDLKGSYLTNNKVTTEDRIGKVFAEIRLLFSPEQLKNMDPSDIDNKINEAFHHDDYEWNKKAHIKYKTKKSMTTNLEDICYKCPKCGTEFKMTSKDSYIKCEHCGNGAYMDHYYDFHPFDENCIIPSSPSKWSLFERECIINEIREDKNYFMEFSCKIGHLPKDHLIAKKANTEIVGEGIYRIDHKGVHFKGTKLGEHFEFDLDYHTIWTYAVSVDLSMLSLYVKGENVDIVPYPKKVGAKAFILTQEMHRLHVNTFKNLPWFDYLYEGKELAIDLIDK